MFGLPCKDIKFINTRNKIIEQIINNIINMTDF